MARDSKLLKTMRPFLVAVVLSTVILTAVSSNQVNSTVGIGLKWFTEGDYAKEGTSICAIYGLYNPFDTDVYGYLTASKDLERLYSSEDVKLVPKGTSSANAIPTEICFKIPDDVHPKNCILGFMCERSCEGVENKLYSGEVIAAYKLDANPGGSAVGSSFAAPMRLVVKCEELKRDYTQLIAIIVAIIIIAAAAFLFLRKKPVPASPASAYPDYGVPKKRGKTRLVKKS